VDPTAAHEQFFHVRVIVGIVTGLSVARLLTGLAGFVQHPERHQIYIVHLGWALFLLLAVVHFWWFEFGLSRITGWTFPVYFFVIFYAALFYFVCVLLFPDRIDEYSGFAHYFHSRQKWFYGLLACLFIVDIADTALKGMDRLWALGTEYLVRQAAMATLAVAAMFVRDWRFHAAFACGGLIYQVSWILRQFAFLQ